MRNILIFLCLVFMAIFVASCSVKSPSQTIAENAKKEIVLVQETVKNIEQQTPDECKTELFLANLKSISNQVSSISGQIESISNSCQTEKKVLEEKITVREVIILLLFFVILVVSWLFLRRK